MVNWGGGAKGAAGGAAAGAALGPWGAAAGGLIGGAIGLFGGDDGDNGRKVDVTMPNYGAATQSLANMAGSAQYRYAPQLDQGLMMQSRGNLMGTANRLGSIASGQQAGAGELAVNRQLGQAYAAQQSAARMARGANSALAYRNMQRNSADMGLQGAGAAAQAQMQDQQAANQQLGQIYGQMYGQDTNAANMNMQAQLSQRQMNDSYQIQSMGQLLGWDQAQVNANLAKAGLPPIPGVGNALLQGGGQALAAYGAYRGKNPSPPSGGGGAPPVFNGGDDLMPNDPTYSDERVKKNIGDGTYAADHVLASMQPYVYEYRDPSMGPGQQLGVTTQDLQRAGLGQAVVPTPAGDAINPGKLAGANTAMLARLSDRVAALEGGARTPSQVRALPAIAAERARAQPIVTPVAAEHPIVTPVIRAIDAQTAAINAETARKNRALGLLPTGAYYPPGAFRGSIYPVGMSGPSDAVNADTGAQ